MRVRNRKLPTQLSAVSHLDLSLSPERDSYYDNLSPKSLSASTPSISNVGKDSCQEQTFETKRTQKRNLTSSGDVDQFSASSNDDLSDFEQEDDLVDLPRDLMKLRSVRSTGGHQENGAEQSKPHRAKVRWHSFERTTRPNIQPA